MPYSYSGDSRPFGVVDPATTLEMTGVDAASVVKGEIARYSLRTEAFVLWTDSD